MRQFYLDTSALVKRYHYELGTEAVNVLVDAVVSGRAKGLLLTLALLETISTLNRKRNERLLDKRLFDKLTKVFYREVERFTILSIDDTKVVSSITHVMRHSLNNADALHLTAALIARESIDSEDDYVMVSSDKRLLKAAKKEKLTVLNPEQVDAAQLKKSLNLK